MHPVQIMHWINAAAMIIMIMSGWKIYNDEPDDDAPSDSIDMPTAPHPQMILATRYAREPITDPFGFLLCLRTATKLGVRRSALLRSAPA